MFTDAELELIRSMVSAGHSADEIAGRLSIHTETLRRRLLRNHHIVLERVSACKLTSLGPQPPQLVAA